MKMSASENIAASREAVWKGLNDLAVLKQCIPGCDTITQKSATEMSAKVTIKLGPVKASFSGSVKLSDLRPPESYRISGKGEGGLAGFAQGGASVKLTALSQNETQLDYDVDAQIGGKMAMLGARVIDSTAQSMATQFFAKFAAVVKKEYGDMKSATAAPAKIAAKKSVAKKTTAKKAKKK